MHEKFSKKRSTSFDPLFWVHKIIGMRKGSISMYISLFDQLLAKVYLYICILFVF